MSPQLLQKIEQSTLQIMSYPLFMHYFSPNTPPNPNDQGWQNQAIFFWEADETFERKSLPPVFQTYDELYFIVQSQANNITVQSGTTFPWFGMPGGASKYAFILNEQQKIPLQQLAQQGIIQYLKIISINENNSHFLQKRGEYYFLMDQNKVQYQNQQFYFGEQTVSFSEAVHRGGFQLVKPIN